MQHCKVCLPEAIIKSSVTPWQPQERKETGLCFFKARSRFSLDTTNDLYNGNMSHTEVISEVTKSRSLYSLKSTPEFCLEAYYWLVCVQSTADLSHKGSVLLCAIFIFLSLPRAFCVKHMKPAHQQYLCSDDSLIATTSQSLPDSPILSSTDRSPINSFICTVHPQTLSQVVWVLSHRQVVLVQVPASCKLWVIKAISVSQK